MNASKRKTELNTRRDTAIDNWRPATCATKHANKKLAFHPYYSYLPEMDNLFKEGSLITAKVAPDRGLMINRYYKRIYYCQPLDDPSHKLLVYFERELIPPTR